MSESDHISTSSEDNDKLQIKQHQVLETIQQPKQQTMKEFLKEHGPQFNVNGRASELDVLNEIGSFQQYLGGELNFNYNFDRESWCYYSQLQNTVRVELTDFRQYIKQMLERDRYKLSVKGYYYELGAVQYDDLRQKDFRGRQEGQRHETEFHSDRNDNRGGFDNRERRGSMNENRDRQYGNSQYDYRNNNRDDRGRR